MTVSSIYSDTKKFGLKHLKKRYKWYFWHEWLMTIYNYKGYFKSIYYFTKRNKKPEFVVNCKLDKLVENELKYFVFNSVNQKHLKGIRSVVMIDSLVEHTVNIRALGIWKYYHKIHADILIKKQSSVLDMKKVILHEIGHSYMHWFIPSKFLTRIMDGNYHENFAEDYAFIEYKRIIENNDSSEKR